MEAIAKTSLTFFTTHLFAGSRPFSSDPENGKKEATYQSLIER
jgi:hypothetical protein